jgi:hypothetical protein
MNTPLENRTAIFAVLKNGIHSAHKFLTGLMRSTPQTKQQSFSNRRRSFAKTTTAFRSSSHYEAIGHSFCQF